MHVVLYSVEEKLMHCIWGLIRHAGCFVRLRDLVPNAVELVSCVQVRYDTRVQRVLDVLQETLLNDVVI